MNVERLKRLADFLRNEVPPERFDISTWVGTSAKPWLGKEDLSCGTVACAMGWATQVPEFRAAGLRLIPSCKSDEGIPVYGDSKFPAITFFGLTRAQEDSIFFPSSYDTFKVTPIMVAERIESLIAGAGAT